MDYAVIESGAVVNLIWLYEGNAGEFPNAVRLDGRPVAIGDTYSDGHFYRDGAEVLTPLESAQAELDSAEGDMAALVEIIYNNDLEVIG